jgi:hypothetical protein
MREVVLCTSTQGKISKAKDSSYGLASYYIVSPHSTIDNTNYKISRVRFSPSSDSILALSSNNSLLLIYIGKNNIACLLKNSSLVCFDFLDENNAHFLALHSNNELAVISKGGKTTQKFDTTDQKGIFECFVSLKFKYFVATSKENASFYFEKPGTKQYAKYQSLHRIGKNSIIKASLSNDQEKFAVLLKDCSVVVYDSFTQQKILETSVDTGATSLLPVSDLLYSFSGKNNDWITLTLFDKLETREEKSESYQSVDTKTKKLELPFGNKLAIKVQRLNSDSNDLILLCEDGTVYLIKDLDSIFNPGQQPKSLRASVFFKAKPQNIVDFELSSKADFISFTMNTGESRIYEVKELLLQTTKDCFNVYITQTETQTHEPEEGQDPMAQSISKILKVKPLYRNKIPKDTLRCEKYRKFLLAYYKYPASKRREIWEYFLDLPQNGKAFDNLKKLGKYGTDDIGVSLKQVDLQRKLETLMFAFAHYCPLMHRNKIFMGILFPFLKLYEDEPLFVFEMTLKFSFHWGQHLFNNYPEPSTTIVTAIQKLVSHFSPELEHFMTAMNLYDVVWSMVTGLYTNVLSRDNWLVIMDHILTYTELPGLYYTLAVALCLRGKEHIMGMKTRQEINSLMHSFSQIDIVELLDTNFKIYEEADRNHLLTLKFSHRFENVGEFYYPPFPFMPKHVVN